MYSSFFYQQYFFLFLNRKAKTPVNKSDGTPAKAKVLNNAIIKKGEIISLSRYAPPKKSPEDVLNTNQKTDKTLNARKRMNIIKNSLNLFILSPPVFSIAQKR